MYITLGSQYNKMTREKKRKERKEGKQKSRKKGKDRGREGGKGKERREEGVWEGEKVNRKNTRAIEAGILKQKNLSIIYTLHMDF